MTQRDDALVSVVVPVFREAAHLGESLAAIAQAAREGGGPLELVVVDDGSPDDTWERLEGLREEVPELRALGFSRNFGKEAAMRAGLEAARGEAVVVMDADLQHPPELLPEMIRAWRAGEAEVVSAVKRRRGAEPLLVGLGARAFYGLFHRFAGWDLHGASDYKLLDRRVVDALCALPERVTFFRGLVPWLGYRELRIPFEVPPRKGGGGSRWSLGRLTRLGVSALTSFSAAPLRAVTVLGGLFLGFAVILGAQTLWNWGRGVAVSGFTTVILLQLMIGSALMLSLGVLGEYLARVFEEVKARPRYLVARRLGEESADPG